jgi:hypothetical protein
MKRAFAVTALLGLSLLLLGSVALGQKDPPMPPPGTVLEDKGAVVKVEKDVIVFQPRTPDGKFGPAIKLNVTGTSRITQAQIQMRDKAVVLAQTDIKYQALTNGMIISAVYASTGDGFVLLSAVVHPKPAPEKDK